MKYILKKDIPGYNKWIIFETPIWSTDTLFNEITKRFINDKEWFEVIEEEQPTKEEIEFLNKYVERRWIRLLIIWENKYIDTFDDWSFVFENIDKKHSDTGKLSFTICNLSDLKEWDVFYIRWDEPGLENINIFIWKDDEWNYVMQYIQSDNWIEYIEVNFDYENCEVIKINRE